MRFSRLQFANYSSGHIWQWGAAGNVIAVGAQGNKGSVTKIESHQDGFFVVTALIDGVPKKFAVVGECVATCCDDEPQCEVCGQFFQNQAGLANHVKSHAPQPVKQVTERHA